MFSKEKELTLCLSGLFESQLVLDSVLLVFKLETLLSPLLLSSEGKENKLVSLQLGDQII